jgi:hypothetical protein
MNLNIIALGVIIVSAGGWLLVHDRKVETKTLKKVAAASQAQGERANAKNEIVRKRASLPGAADRLRSDPRSCPSCFSKSLP